MCIPMCMCVRHVSLYAATFFWEYEWFYSIELWTLLADWKRQNIVVYYSLSHDLFVFCVAVDSRSWRMYVKPCFCQLNPLSVFSLYRYAYKVLADRKTQTEARARKHKGALSQYPHPCRTVVPSCVNTFLRFVLLLFYKEECILWAT